RMFDKSTETLRLEGFSRLKACSGPDRVTLASVTFVPSMTHWGERLRYSMGRVKSRRTRSFWYPKANHSSEASRMAVAFSRGFRRNQPRIRSALLFGIFFP